MEHESAEPVHAPTHQQARPSRRRRGTRGRPRIQERRSALTGRVYLYGDFRGYADVGGKVEPLVPPGERCATSDPGQAARLYANRLAELQTLRAARESRGRPLAAPAAQPAGAPAGGSSALPEVGSGSDQSVPTFAPMIDLHLARKAAPRSGRRGSTLKRDRACLARLRRYFGDCPLSAITPVRLDAYVVGREQQPGCRHGTLVSPNTIRNELHALSSLFRRAVALGYVTSNPGALGVRLLRWAWSPRATAHLQHAGPGRLAAGLMGVVALGLAWYLVSAARVRAMVGEPTTAHYAEALAAAVTGLLLLWFTYGGERGRAARAVRAASGAAPEKHAE